MADDLHCSVWARAQEIDPIGSAGTYAGYLLVEWPLPWRRDVSEIPELAPVAAAARQTGHRLQALAPVPARASDRVVHYAWDTAVGRYTGREAPAGGDAASVALAFLSGEQPAGARPTAGTDLLVCGHGRRDRCCGSLGVALEAELLRRDPVPPAPRVWRTSHTGGHRFAPTAVVLPEGTCWGYLDARAMDDIVSRRGPVGAHLHRYRGCAGLGSAATQAIERAVLAEVGWALLDRPRRGEEDGDGTARLVVTEADGRVRTWEGRVAVRRVMAVPQCGQPLTGGEKTEEELSVDGLRELSVTGGP